MQGIGYDLGAPDLAGKAALCCVGAEDEFAFSCAGCGRCCENRNDLILSAYDLYRLSAWMRLPPSVVADAFCDSYYGESSGLPVIRLKPKKNSTHSCPFYQKHRCTVHPARPLACALFPLGQQIEGTAVQYYDQHCEYGNRTESGDLKRYLSEAGILQRQRFDICFAELCTKAAEILRKIPENDPGKNMLKKRLRYYFYLNYSQDEPFAVQFERNRNRILELAEKVVDAVKLNAEK